MKMKLMCMSIILLLSYSVEAQKKIRFNSINMAGLIVGKENNSSLIQTINGVSYHNWFAGIGAGMDNYYYKSIPVFLDVRTIIPKTNVLVFADPGYNFSYKNTPDEKVGYYSDYNFKGGFYSEIGLGYKVKLNKTVNILFTSGYSYKSISIKSKAAALCFTTGSCPVDIKTYQYEFSKLQFKAGISF